MHVQVCPNTNCRAKLELKFPLSSRASCPRCHCVIDLYSEPGLPTLQKTGYSFVFRDPRLQITIRRNFMPDWMIGLCVLGIVGLAFGTITTTLNIFHLNRHRQISEIQAKNRLFVMNLYYSPPGKDFKQQKRSMETGWNQWWFREVDRSIIAISMEDFQAKQPDADDIEQMTIARLEKFLPNTEYQVAIKLGPNRERVGGDEWDGSWIFEATYRNDDTARISGKIMAMLRRGYGYWFVSSGPEEKAEERTTWANGLLFGNARADWKPQIARELKILSFNHSLSLDPDIWQLLDAKQSTDLNQHPQMGDIISNLRFEIVLQGKKNRSGSLDGGLKVYSMLYAVTASDGAGDMPFWQGAWKNRRIALAPNGDVMPEVKFSPVNGQADLFRMIVNGQFEELVLIIPFAGEKPAAWLASCGSPDSLDWQVEFLRIRRGLQK